MKVLTKIFFVVFISPILLARGGGEVLAQNIVPNPSFEQFSSCPLAYLEFYKVLFWGNPNDNGQWYFDTCASTASGAGVPDNVIGHQFARSGGGYAGITSYYPSHNCRTYISVRLTDSLTSGKTYKVSFYVSLADSSMCAIDNIGAYLSKDSVYVPGLFYLPDTPQVVSIAGVTISDTSEWILISGNYIALGGEKYLTIGTFVPDSLLTIDTLLTVTTSYQYYATYYIDDVSVSDTSVGVGNLQNAKEQVSVYPNPGVGNFTVRSPQSGINKIEVYNILGEKVMSIAVSGERLVEINLSKEPAGMYFVIVGNHCAKVIKE